MYSPSSSDGYCAAAGGSEHEFIYAIESCAPLTSKSAPDGAAIMHRYPTVFANQLAYEISLSNLFASDYRQPLNPNSVLSFEL
jgi:hypothetical protein